LAEGAQFREQVYFKTHEDLNPNLGNALEMTLPEACKPGS